MKKVGLKRFAGYQLFCFSHSIIAMERKKIIIHNYFKLAEVSCVVSVICVILAFSIKHLTEYLELEIFTWVKSYNPVFFIVLPTIGITMIYFLRKFAFRNRKNKG